MPSCAPIIVGMKQFAPLLLACLISTSPIHAAVRQDMGALQQAVRNWLDQSLANSPGASTYQISTLDRNLQLAACRDMQVTLPPGYRLLGRTLVRVQCIEGASWSVSVPVQVSINVTYFVAARPLAANQEVREGDLSAQEGDLANLPGSVILDPALAMGRILNSSIAAGNPVRQEMLRSPIVIRQNQKVRVLFRESSIEVMNEGTALSNAQEGQPVRVKVGNGQTVQGIAKANGSVEVSQ